VAQLEMYEFLASDTSCEGLRDSCEIGMGQDSEMKGYEFHASLSQPFVARIGFAMLRSASCTTRNRQSEAWLSKAPVRLQWACTRLQRQDKGVPTPMSEVDEKY
jgi:hypothetical protein